MSLAESQDTSKSLISPPLAMRTVCACLSLMLPVFALATFQWDYAFTASRYFSVPVLVFELLMLAVMVLAGARPSNTAAALSPLFRACLIVLLIVALSATVLATFQTLGWIFFSVTVLHFALALTLWDFLSRIHPTDGWPYLAALGWGLTTYTLIVLVAIAAVWSYPDFRWQQFGLAVGSVRELGFFGMILFGIGLGAIIRSPPSAKSIGLLWCTVGLLLVFLGGGRAAFGAAVLAFLTVLALVPDHRSGIGKICCLAFALAALPGFVIAPHETWGLKSILLKSAALSELDAGYDSARWPLWIATYDAILDRPYLGHGEGQFRFSLEAAQLRHHQPHNVLLQVLYQWGFAGAAVLTIAGIGFFTWLRKGLAQPSSVQVAALAIMVGLGAASTLDGALYYFFPVMTFVLAATILVHATARRVGTD